MHPRPEDQQLSSYHNEQMRAYNEFMLAPMMGVGKPYNPIGNAGPNYWGQPLMYSGATNYAAMSQAPATEGVGASEVSGASDIGGGAADGAEGSY